MKISEKKVKKSIGKLLIFIFWLVLWEILSVFINNPLLFAGPLETLLRLCRDMLGIHFWLTVGFSICKIMVGFLLGMFVGCFLGILSYKWHFFKELMAPIMHFCKAVPVASFIVVLLIWWGSNFLSTASCFLVVLPMAYVNFWEGLTHSDKSLLEMAETFHMPLKNRIFYLYRPALLPFMEGCTNTALGMGIKAGIAAEVIGISDFSIGGAMYLSKIYLDTSGVFSWTAVVIIISIILEKLVRLGLNRLFMWNPRIAKHDKEKIVYEEIELKKIMKVFQDKKVIQNLDKSFLNHEIVCLMGPSGCGKTTLLHIMAGILKPDEGQIIYRISGIDTGKSKLYPGMVFQEDRLCEELNAIQNVRLVSHDSQSVVECLTQLLPEDALTIPVKNLSGGMRRRVCIARALVSPTDFLLMDEPFSGLDEEARKRTIDVILRYQQNRLLIVVTHDESDLAFLSAKLWRFSIPRGSE